MAKVTGVGGVFIQAKTDAKALTQWYADVLGVAIASYGGAVLRWREDPSHDTGATAWHVAGPDSQWFAPSTSTFMINYRVDDMAGMIERIRAAGVALHHGPETHDNGIFAWVIDPDGNKVELWEPKTSK